MSENLLKQAPFDASEWQQAQQLIQALNQNQALWLSGYLAAMHGSAPTQNVGPENVGQKVLIAYGTETDNSKHLAEQLLQQCQSEGINAEVADLATVRVRKLKKLETLVIITATHGDGEPPEPISEFYETLMADNAPKLKQLSFAVLALGDSSYEHYCVTGVYIDQRLEALGAKRLLERVDCDVDFEEPASTWQKNVLQVLPKSEQAVSNASAVKTTAPDAQAFGKKNPIDVEVLKNQNLSSPARKKPVHHLELALEHEGFVVEPGDAVGVFADNPPELVAQILDSCELSGEAAVTVNDKAMALVEALRSTRDLTIPSKSLLTLWAELTAHKTLQNLLEGDSKTVRAHLKQQQVLDIVKKYPATPEPQKLVDALRPLQPRLYDVANSLDVVDDELHLTVKAFDYPIANRVEKGIASRFLLDVQAGESISIYPHKNARFRLPEDATKPIILIADSTGIAPYRAFLQALQNLPAPPPCWLVFSEQHYEDDFLYQLDIQKAKNEGVLKHVDTVFYADARFKEATLATPLLQQSKTFLNWLKQDAHIYFCGDKSTLEACEKTLKTYVDGEIGEGQWQQLAKAKNIHRNLY